MQSDQPQSSEVEFSDPAGTVPDAATKNGLSGIVPDSGPPSNSAPPSSGSVITPGSPQNRFIGAGIVQRAGDSAQGSGYVLMSPAGKVLADLKTSGSVSLDAYLGQQV